MAEDIQEQSAIYEKPEDIKSKQDLVKRWLETIELSSKEEKDWRKDVDEAREVYESGDKAITGTAFNLYHANIETIVPALYNSTPVPDIRRRFNDRDPAAKAGADCIERVLSYSIDEYDFDGVMRESVFDLAVAGRGLARVVKIEEILPDESDVGAQSVECRVVPWASFRRGPGRSWDEVPWVAFAHYMTRDAMKELDPVKGGKVTLDTLVSGDDQGNAAGAQQDTPESDIFKRSLVWEIWDKEKTVVRFIAPGYSEDQLAEVQDPMKLKGFFPIPKPMMTGKASGRLVPLCPYRVYKPLLDEIDTLTKRIKRLIKQLRPRALGPKGVDLEAWAAADDGSITEVSEVMAFLESGGMDKLLAWFPMEPTIKAIESLYARREQAKGELFEVSGLADVMRGQTNPNETKGAQDLKQRWGSLRLQFSQSEVQRFARDLFRLKAEVIATFKPENLAVMSGMQLDDQALQVIVSDQMRGYRIDIETDSTIKGDLTRNQEAMAQFVGGSAQYFAAVAPIVESGGMSKTAAVTIYSAFARNFKLGKEVDAVLDQLADEATKAEQMQAQQGPPKNPEVIKAEAEAQANAAKQQSDAQHQQAEDQAKLMKADGDSKAAIIKANSEASIKKQEQADEAILKRDLAMGEAATNKELAFAKIAVDAYISMQSQQAANQIKAAEVGIKTREKAAEKNQQSQGNDQLAKGMAEMGKAIIVMGENMLKAQTAPRSVTTPDGRTYTSKAMQ